MLDGNTQRKSPRKHQHHLLCVDDQKTTVLLTAQVLESKGYQVTALSNPLNAIEVFRREKIELAVLDYQMPEMSGAHLAAQIKSAYSKVKIILFTGTLQVPESDLSLVDEIVQKSDGPPALLATIDRLLRAA
jgi:CheY-like chemotaxis protein